MSEVGSFNERLAAIARALLHEPDVQATLRRTVADAAATLDGALYASVSLVLQRRVVETPVYTDDRALLRDKIRLTIERHEPRLAKVRVSLDAPQGAERMLRFRVDAVLKVHPSRPPVSFDAMLQLSSNTCSINER